jgi:CrcB protein
MLKWINLIIGGVIGTLARYFLAGAVYQICGASFPYGTLVVNLIGCFLVGFFVTLADDKFLLGPNARLLLMIGFCGAFTTFSTFMLETANLMKDGQNFRAFLNVGGSIVFGFVVFKLGILLGKII